MVRIGWETTLDLGRKAFLAPLPIDAAGAPLFCVSTVSIVCTKAPVPVRAADSLDPLQSIVADAADGTDGVMQLVLAYGRYPDCARSEPPLAAEYNLNPKRAEEGLCPP